MIETVKTLCRLPGVSGNEDAVREYIKTIVKDIADEIIEDTMGNLIVFKKGVKTPKKKIMLSAHMDEVGIIVTDITDDGYLKFECIGGMDRRVLPGKSVFVGADGVHGVIGTKAVHLVSSEERKKVPKVADMYIDIGAKDKESAKKLVSLGETGAFDDSVFEYGDRFIKAKALDDRVGCAIMLELIKKELPVDCHFVFTVQEEVGCRGMFGAAFRIEPDVSLVIETTTAADLPGVEGNKKVCTLGGGAVVPFMDGATIYNRGLYEQVTKLAERKGISWQTKTQIAGGNDSSAVQRSGAGAKAIAVSVAVRNIHSPASVAKISDIEAVYALVAAFLDEMGADC